MNKARVRFAFPIGVAATGVLLSVTLTAQPDAGIHPAAERSHGRSVSAPLVEQLPVHATDCWITGDLVGDANPAAIQRVLCAS